MYREMDRDQKTVNRALVALGRVDIGIMFIPR